MPPEGANAAQYLKAKYGLDDAQLAANRTRIVERGDEPGGGTPEQLGTLTRTHYKMWGDVVKANNIQAD